MLHIPCKDLNDITRPAEPVSRREWSALVVAGLLWIVVVVIIAAFRATPNFGAETDFFLRFAPDAERFLAGAPMELRYHPPFYSILLAGVYLIVGDWFTAGLVLSAASALLFAASCYVLVRRLFSATTATLSILTLPATYPFVVNSTVATSDMLAAALFLAAVATSLFAVSRPQIRSWLMAGLFVGAAILTRSTAVFLPVLLLLPWLRESRVLTLPRPLLFQLAGFALPVLLWAIYAGYSGSPFGPTATHTGLAWRFFGNDRMFDQVEALYAVQFSSMVDVFLHDPVTILKTYLRELFSLGFRLLSPGTLIAAPLTYLAVPGLLYALIYSRPLQLLFVFVFVPQLLIGNLLIFDSRYYLFMLPLLVMGVAITFQLLRLALSRELHRKIAAGFFAGVVVYAIVVNALSATEDLRAAEEELLAAAQIVEDYGNKELTIVARKPQLGYVTGSRFRLLNPLATTVEALARDLHERPLQGPALLFLGSQESMVQHELIRDIASANPDWMTLAGQSADSGQSWKLYRLELPGPSN